MNRIIVPELDGILGDKIHVLHSQGWLRVMDYMGGDKSVINAARNTVEGAKAYHDDSNLLRYLLRHWHSTPFEFATITLQIYVPMDCWRQWIRHRMFSVNEYSTRYSEAIEDCQTTPEWAWRLQSKGNRQGSSEERLSVGDPIDDAQSGAKNGIYFTDREAALHKFSREVYQERVDAGIALEQARKDLPLSNFTLAYWTGDLWNLMHFLRLRMDTHAQKEIREYATAIGENIVKVWAPASWRAFNDYQHHSQSFSRMELLLISEINTCVYSRPRFNDNRIDYTSVFAMASEFGWIQYHKEELGYFCDATKRNREREEFEEKLKMINIPIPWKEEV
jgi:thymidylate synthase (FAD)